MVFLFEIEMKNEKQNSSLNFNVQLFWKSNKHLDLCLSFSIETTIKSLFLISYFTLSKKWNGTLVTRIHIGSKNFDFYISRRYSVKKSILKSLAELTGNYLRQRLFFSKVTVWLLFEHLFYRTFTVYYFWISSFTSNKIDKSNT